MPIPKKVTLRELMEAEDRGCDLPTRGKKRLLLGNQVGSAEMENLTTFLAALGKDSEEDEAFEEVVGRG